MVTDADTARALGSGDVDVLGTPKVVALCEQAAVAAVGPDGTTVGVRIDIEHLSPTPVGHRVVAQARLQTKEGRTLTFDIEAWDAAGVIARGTHVRVVVDRERFIQSANE